MNKQNQIARGLMAVRADAEGGFNIEAAFTEMNTAFAQFKAAQDERIAALDKGGEAGKQEANALRQELQDLKASMDEMAVQMAGGQMQAGKKADNEAVKAMTGYIKTGEISAALKTDSEADGGYLVPNEWDRTIIDKLVEISPVRALFGQQTTSRAKFSKLVNKRGAASGWVGETDERPETGTPTLATLEFETGEQYANPAATQTMLDDAETNVEAWLSEEVQIEFSDKETKAFINGDGAKGKPRGLLTYAAGGANASRHPLGAIGHVVSGNANTITADGLIDLTDELPAAFQQAAVFIMNKKTRNVARKLKDSEGNYLWERSLQAGIPPTLLGYPVHIVAEMPDAAANAFPIAFGDFKRGYLILDRIGVRVLRDPYTKKPFVQFYTTKRVGGGVQNPECMKLMKIAAA